MVKVDITRQTVFGAAVKLASVTGGFVFAVGFLMTVLGWRFTGNADLIAQNTVRITGLETRVLPIEEQNKATLFMLCPIYRKSFPGSPVPDVCPKSDP